MWVWLGIPDSLARVFLCHVRGRGHAHSYHAGVPRQLCSAVVGSAEAARRFVWRKWIPLSPWLMVEKTYYFKTVFL